MTIVINVTLDTKTNFLNVDDNGGQNNVNQNPNPQTIQWQLSGNAATGSFLALVSADSPTGFQWLTQPPPSTTIFGTPGFGANGTNTKQIQIVDNHTSASSNGTWMYKLRANINGTVYETEGASLRGTTKNPIIINK